jgi:hypothetical protein
VRSPSGRNRAARKPSNRWCVGSKQKIERSPSTQKENQLGDDDETSTSPVREPLFVASPGAARRGANRIHPWWAVVTWTTGNKGRFARGHRWTRTVSTHPGWARLRARLAWAWAEMNDAAGEIHIHRADLSSPLLSSRAAREMMHACGRPPLRCTHRSDPANSAICSNTPPYWTRVVRTRRTQHCMHEAG